MYKRQDFPEEKYYNSNGGRRTYDGARCWKWHYQTDGSLKEYTVSMDNDFAIFRYADVVLMYVEALVRQNRASEAVQPVSYTHLTLQMMNRQKKRFVILVRKA